MNSAYVSKLFNTDSSREFILDFMSKNKQQFTGMTVNQYYSSYAVSDAMLLDLVEYGKKNKVEFDSNDFNKSKEYLRILVKAHLGRQIFDDSAFYKVINDINEVYLQALNLFGEADKISMAPVVKSTGDQ
jgi:carboxyl-terminal processing protease